MEEEAAERLVSERKIRIGLVNCAVEQRITVLSCRNCGAYDHLARGCSRNTDRKCFKCGGSGHIAKDCESGDLFCSACEEKGHKRGGYLCKSFRAALQSLKKKKREEEMSGRRASMQ